LCFSKYVWQRAVLDRIVAPHAELHAQDMVLLHAGAGSMRLRRRMQAAGALPDVSGRYGCN
jgi:hypothetical protein